ncbi:hypothetical protein [Flavobacterium sp. HSC-61S13]|uniref:hypothetical protein n=1 Tax=Flavobacterium sp. HSC-61S13 TaxID=2910963 RepID=UPI00209D6A73|nr:hypothetical protein [Flavobacterium sp. HSC-61S13]MCP1996830.1 hypothetical protein [Flavobacterium sp. HSC-61S13]
MKFLFYSLFICYTTFCFAQASATNPFEADLALLIKRCNQNIQYATPKTILKKANNSAAKLTEMAKEEDHWSCNYFCAYYTFIAYQHANKITKEAYSNKLNNLFFRLERTSHTAAQKSECKTLKAYFLMQLIQDKAFYLHPKLVEITIKELFEEALQHNPKNPRTVYLYQFFKTTDIKSRELSTAFCKDIMLANQYFKEEAQNENSHLFPKWGAKDIQPYIKNCSVPNK